jgi:hypothetical protein
VEAGKQLDALIAEKVFGWRRVEGPKFDEDESYRAYPPRGKISLWFFTRNWSTDISLAWQIVEALTIRGFEVEIKNVDAIHLVGRQWYVEIRGWEAWANTAPHAICLAALKAVGGA